jgi:hypothetical protein
MTKQKPLSSTTFPPRKKIEVATRGGLPLTLEECLLRIAALGQRINGYVQAMCQVDSLAGSSSEAKDRAVRAFHERLTAVESQLGKIHDDLHLE